MTLNQVPRPEPLSGQAVVQVLLAGICNTDLELLRGYYGFSGVPGHEFVGRVVSASNPTLINRRVCGEINLACGHCDFCKRDLGRHCARRTVLGIVGHPGAFADFVTLPERNLHPIPDTISNQDAVFVEPLAAACEILEQIAIIPDTPVAVLGDGKLGLLVAQVLHQTGAAVTLYGRHEDKLAIARSRGIKTSLEQQIRSKYPVAIECTGSAAGLEQAVSITEPRGTVVMKSTVHEKVQLDMAPVIVNEISLIGSRCGRFEPAIQLLAEQRVNVRSMIAAEYPLSEARAAMAHAGTRGTLKVTLRPLASEPGTQAAD